ncbi:uncharacterized protein LOC130663653 [Microplitis mediator]|uniref:uncharacterized protein LOC130663653 n=1 Tax=Microplitis mediator TaxID=375433 RepID=UPI002553D89A|nr:uncharacterized protein LOC130663653 [Microplitis mediator]
MEKLFIICLISINILIISNNLYDDGSVYQVEHETINETRDYKIFDIWAYSWTVVIEISVRNTDSDFEPLDGEFQYHYCTGSLLKPYLVLTSAACIHDVISHYNEFGISVLGDYNRSEKVIYITKSPSLNQNEKRVGNESGKVKEAINKRKSFKMRYIYYYNFAEKYNSSEPDIALIGLKKSILFGNNEKITIPIASKCHHINYDKCLITRITESKRENSSYTCSVKFTYETVFDELSQQSRNISHGKLNCHPKDLAEHNKFCLENTCGGNPIVCQINGVKPAKYVQVGHLKAKNNRKNMDYIYIPDVIDL